MTDCKHEVQIMDVCRACGKDFSAGLRRKAGGMATDSRKAAERQCECGEMVTTKYRPAFDPILIREFRLCSYCFWRQYNNPDRKTGALKEQQ